MMSFNDMTSKDFIPDYCTVVMFGEFRYPVSPEEPSFDDPKKVQVFCFILVFRWIVTWQSDCRSLLTSFRK